MVKTATPPQERKHQAAPPIRREGERSPHPKEGKESNATQKKRGVATPPKEEGNQAAPPNRREVNAGGEGRQQHAKGEGTNSNKAAPPKRRWEKQLHPKEAMRGSHYPKVGKEISTGDWKSNTAQRKRRQSSTEPKRGEKRHYPKDGKESNTTQKRRGVATPLILQEQSCTSELFKVIQDAILLILHYKTMY